MKTHLSLVLLFVGTIGFGQIKTGMRPEEARKIALDDIAANRTQLYLQGGFAPIPYSAAHKAFETKFAVKFNDFGCVAPEKKLVEAYNFTVFNYLDKTFGSEWRKEIRPDAIGLAEYLKRKP